MWNSNDRGSEPERRKLAWMWLSTPKGRDVEDMESEEGGMARDVLLRGWDRLLCGNHGRAATAVSVATSIYLVRREDGVMEEYKSEVVPRLDDEQLEDLKQ